MTIRADSWTDAALREKAKELYGLGYKSSEPFLICRRFGMPYERAVNICRYIREYEERAVKG